MIDRLFWLLFSFHGRIGRTTFAILTLLQLVAWELYQVLLVRGYMVVTYDAAHKPHAVFDTSPAVSAVMLFLVAVALWVSLAAQVKRLHDFSWSGQWLVVPVGGGLIAGFLATIFAALQLRAGLMLVSPLLVLAAVALFGLVLMMFFRPGDPEENGHQRGPDEDATMDDADPYTARGQASARRDGAHTPSPAGFGRADAAHTFGRRGVGR